MVFQFRTARVKSGYQVAGTIEKKPSDRDGLAFTMNGHLRLDQGMNQRSPKERLWIWEITGNKEAAPEC